MRRVAHPLVFSAAAAVAMALLGLLSGSTPASAHLGGRLQLFLQSLRTAPRGDSETIVVTLADRDSGAPAVGYATTVEGHNATGATFGPVTLAPGANGTYNGELRVAPGDWDVTVKAEAAPGTEAAGPLTVTRTVAFGRAAGNRIEAQAPSHHRDMTRPLLVSFAFLATGAMVLLNRRRPRARAGPAPSRR
ncbi:MAG: hypothetical protein LC792_05925 [Actinobacteria bacterium]|nr:hypothetical protein [Actinomycetota bacterium]